MAETGQPTPDQILQAGVENIAAANAPAADAEALTLTLDALKRTGAANRFWCTRQTLSDLKPRLIAA